MKLNKTLVLTMLAMPVLAMAGDDAGGITEKITSVATVIGAITAAATAAVIAGLGLRVALKAGKFGAKAISGS